MLQKTIIGKLILNSVQITKQLRWVLLGVGLIFSMQVMAQGGGSGEPLDAIEDRGALDRIKEIKETKGKGWQISTKGGIAYVNPQDERFWFGIGGVIRLDQVAYCGNTYNKKNQFPNSAFIRRIEPGLEGGVGENWEYAMSLQFSSASDNGGANGIQTRLQDTWLGYTGFSKNSEVFFGRLSGNWFGLDGSTGGTWMPFMERSAQANAFYPGDGIGIMADMWWDNGAITVIGLEPDQNDRVLADHPAGGRRKVTYRSDRWRAIGRATYAPVACLGNVWHFGVSGAYARLDPSLWGVVVKNTYPGGIPPGGVSQRDPRVSRFLLQLPPTPMSYVTQWNVEAARQWGPFIAEAEYTEAFVHRVSDPQGALRFKGWNTQARYMLTGEAHTYDVRDGSFGKVDICSPYGAFEVAVRYDYINLNDKNAHGGSQHDFTTGLNWFINSQVRLSGNYIRANFRPATESTHRKLNVFAMRLQIKFK